MEGNHAPKYNVDHLSEAAEQLHALAQRAVTLGLGQELAKALKEVVSNLESAPLLCGEPQFHTQLAGGVVRHAVINGLSVGFVVYENQHIVVVMKIAPVGNHPLADQ
jgi:hypothetical protein